MHNVSNAARLQITQNVAYFDTIKLNWNAQKVKFDSKTQRNSTKLKNRQPENALASQHLDEH